MRNPIDRALTKQGTCYLDAVVYSEAFYDLTVPLAVTQGIDLLKHHMQTMRGVGEDFNINQCIPDGVIPDEQPVIKMTTGIKGFDFEGVSSTAYGLMGLDFIETIKRILSQKVKYTMNHHVKMIRASYTYADYEEIMLSDLDIDFLAPRFLDPFGATIKIKDKEYKNTFHIAPYILFVTDPSGINGSVMAVIEVAPVGPSATDGINRFRTRVIYNKQQIELSHINMYDIYTKPDELTLYDNTQIISPNFYMGNKHGHVEIRVDKHGSFQAISSKKDSKINNGKESIYLKHSFVGSIPSQVPSDIMDKLMEVIDDSILPKWKAQIQQEAILHDLNIKLTLDKQVINIECDFQVPFICKSKQEKQVADVYYLRKIYHITAIITKHITEGLQNIITQFKQNDEGIQSSSKLFVGTGKSTNDINVKLKEDHANMSFKIT